MKLPFEPRRVRAIAIKEVRHILRDPFTLAMALVLPLMIVSFFGYVMDLDPREIRVMVSDRDNTRGSRELARMFSASGFFRVSPAPPGLALARILDGERAKAVLVIEKGFGRKVSAGETARVQVLLDGSDNSNAGVMLGYLAGLERLASARLTDSEAPAPIRLETRFLFNPELNSRWFIVPGLFAFVIAILAVMLTALTVAREWETGSMELLLSTPVRPAEIVIGKIAPYLALISGAIVLVYLMARILLGVPFNGSHLLFLVSCLLFLLPCLAQGLLISVAVRQQTLAIQIGLVSSLLPSMVLSGFIFPIESMPDFFYYLTAILPPRWFVGVCRGIFLKDAGIGELVVPLSVLTLLSFVLVGASIKRFKADLEP